MLAYTMILFVVQSGIRYDACVYVGQARPTPCKSCAESPHALQLKAACSQLVPHGAGRSLIRASAAALMEHMLSSEVFKAFEAQQAARTTRTDNNGGMPSPGAGSQLGSSPNAATAASLEAAAVTAVDGGSLVAVTVPTDPPVDARSEEDAATAAAVTPYFVDTELGDSPPPPPRQSEVPPAS